MVTQQRPYVLEPKTQAFVDALSAQGGTPIYELSYGEARSATAKQLEGLPPALVIVDENDVLRDEGEAYARKLMEAGVDVTAVRFLATHHDFVMLNALADTPAAKAAIRLASDKLITGLYR